MLSIFLQMEDMVLHLRLWQLPVLCSLLSLTSSPKPSGAEEAANSQQHGDSSSLSPYNSSEYFT